jgi:hypothetical protein
MRLVLEQKLQIRPTWKFCPLYSRLSDATKAGSGCFSSVDAVIATNVARAPSLVRVFAAA